MLENPYLTPPQVEGPASHSWAMGFAFGFQGPAQSSMTPADISPEDADAFDAGVLAGQDAAIHGLQIYDNPCVDLHAEGPGGPHLATEVAGEVTEAGMLGYSLYLGHIAASIGEGLLLIVTLSIALETFNDDPDQALREEAGQLQELLTKLGFTQSMELFIGGAVDPANTGCELSLTSIFRDQAAATDAAKAIGRSKWLVCSWRTDQSGGMRLVACSPN